MPQRHEGCIWVVQIELDETRKAPNRNHAKLLSIGRRARRAITRTRSLFWQLSKVGNGSTRKEVMEVIELWKQKQMQEINSYSCSETTLLNYYSNSIYRSHYLSLCFCANINNQTKLQAMQTNDEFSQNDQDQRQGQGDTGHTPRNSMQENGWQLEDWDWDWNNWQAPTQSIDPWAVYNCPCFCGQCRCPADERNLTLAR